ncbi:facilitated trehalose transporter Tret1-like isoform X2 [Microplitis mediator]|uniref:facilitated trehalose transporter Tret1-like isoform X2 n=1 Tax=Microplitis mediator TaxID=375433 RepID=UPI002555BF20|nr:facilitated trehalose transporter Tret1-like isoform X2 [Microplitis mediator]
MTDTNGTLLEKPEVKVCSDKGAKWSQWKQWLAAISATLSMVAVGTVYGWSTTMLLRLEKGENVPMKITGSESSWVVSLTVIASMCGSFLGAFLADYFGRKVCLLCSSMFFIGGWFAIIFAVSANTLYVARIIQGISVGISYTANPMYVSEVADTNIRGALGTLIAVNVFTGSLLTCCVGPYVSYKALGIVLLGIPILFVATFVWFPESPYYLAMKNRHTAAAKAIAFFKNVDLETAHRELQIIVNNINEEKAQSENWKIKIRHLLSSNNRKAFFIVLMLIVVQQLSGNFTTMQFLTQLFETANVGIDVNIATIIVFAVGLVSGTLATMTVEHAGRRKLLMWSSFSCAAALAILATYLFLKYLKYNIESIKLLPLFVIVLFQIVYQIGLGTLPNAIIGELFPTNAKGVAAAGITISDGILGFLVSIFYKQIEDAWGTHTLYFSFAMSCFIGFIFVVFCIPETKNKSFLEIQQELSRRGFRYNRSFKEEKETEDVLSSGNLSIAPTTFSTN